MEKFIPYEKLSKKKKRELNESKRTRWTISPVTRRPENPKAYNRKKAQKRMDDPGSVLSFFLLPYAHYRAAGKIMDHSGSAAAGQSPGKLVV
jgi:hypothetical protein